MIENQEFSSFIITESNEVDMQVEFWGQEELLQVPPEICFSGRGYKIASDKDEKVMKFFYEKNTDLMPYALAKYDLEGNYIRVYFQKKYLRCVSELRNCFFHIGIESILLRRKKICLHASSIDTYLGGILFSGVSGIGKSTQAELWGEFRGARQLNGDRPILSKEDNVWKVWGSPYAGSSKYYVNESCPITAIVLLKQAKRCTLEKLSFAKAFKGVWAGLTIQSWDPYFVQEASLLTIDLVKRIPVYEFSCTPDKTAVEFLEKELRKECLQ